jgi:hypothetical protein
MDSPQGTQEIGALHDQAFQGAQHASRYQRRPPGSTWFTAPIGGKGPQQQMFEHAGQHNHSFMVAYDWIPIGTEVKKMYASYSTCDRFIQDTLLKIHPQDRHFYELVQDGKRCKPYLDIEWIGPDDQEKTVVHHLVDAFKAYVKVRDSCHSQPKAFEDFGGLLVSLHVSVHSALSF